MSNIVEYDELVAFHPGYYIADVIDDLGISQAEFAARMGTTAKTVSKLINGQANISNDLAKKLANMMGTSVEVWLDLQRAYDEKLIEIEQLKGYEEQKEYLNQIDYKYFVNFAGLDNTKQWTEKIQNLCGFLKISNLEILAKPDFLLNYRTSIPKVELKNVINSRAWIQTAINFSKDIDTKPFSAEKLKKHLPELRGMTVQSPDIFLPRMRKIFAECGVAFVLLPHLKNSGVNGAVKWINSERVVLAMNDRGLYADKFWFSLFHEIKHVLQQKLKTVFISGDEKEIAEINQDLEDEADNFAMNYLIPPEAMSEFLPSRYTTDDEIVSFAKSIGIHPGIVAGRLQHERIIPQNRCSKLKEQYQIVV